MALLPVHARSFSCVWPLWMVLAPVAHAEDPAPRSALSIRQVYKCSLLPARPDPNLCGAHMIGQGHILVETMGPGTAERFYSAGAERDKDHDLFICDTADGSIVSRLRLRDLLADPELIRDSQLPGPAVRHARYSDERTLVLIVVGALKATYVAHDVELSTTVRQDMSDLLHGLYSSIVRLPHRESLIMGFQGSALRQLVHVIDMRTRESVQVLRPKKAKHEITCLAFSHDGKYAAATGNSVYVWELATGKRINDAYQPAWNRIKEWGGYWPGPCSFSRDGKLLAVIAARGHLLVFNVSSAELLLVEKERTYWGLVHSVTFLGETRYILGVGSYAMVFDFSARKWVPVPAFEEDGRLIRWSAVAFGDQSIFLCDGDGNLRRFDWSVEEK